MPVKINFTPTPATDSSASKKIDFTPAAVQKNVELPNFGPTSRMSDPASTPGGYSQLDTTDPVLKTLRFPKKVADVATGAVEKGFDVAGKVINKTITPLVEQQIEQKYSGLAGAFGMGREAGIKLYRSAKGQPTTPTDYIAAGQKAREQFKTGVEKIAPVAVPMAAEYPLFAVPGVGETLAGTQVYSGLKDLLARDYAPGQETSGFLKVGMGALGGFSAFKESPEIAHNNLLFDVLKDVNQFKFKAAAGKTFGGVKDISGKIGGAIGQELSNTADAFKNTKTVMWAKEWATPKVYNAANRTAEDILNLGKRDRQIEIDWNKDNSKMLVDNGLLKFVARDDKGNLDTTKMDEEARKIYRGRFSRFSKILENSPNTFSIDDLQTNAEDLIRKAPKAKADPETVTKLKEIQKTIDFLKGPESYGATGMPQLNGTDLSVNSRDFFDIKAKQHENSKWSLDKSNAERDASRAVATAAKEMMEKSFKKDKIDMDGINKELGDWISLIGALKKANAGKVKSSGLDRWLLKGLTILEAPGGLPGKIVANWTIDKIINAYQESKPQVLQAMLEELGQTKEGTDLLQQAEEQIIKQKYPSYEGAGKARTALPAPVPTLALPKPMGSQPTNVLPAGKEPIPMQVGNQSQKWIDTSKTIELPESATTLQKATEQLKAGEIKAADVKTSVTGLKEAKRQYIADWLAGTEEGQKLTMEHEANTDQKAVWDTKISNDVVSGIKNNPFYKKEGDIKDIMGEGWLMENSAGRKIVAAGKDEIDSYLAKGYSKRIEIDQLAQEAGYDNGYDYLVDQVYMSGGGKITSAEVSAHQSLMKTDQNYKNLNETISKLDEELKTWKTEKVPLEQRRDILNQQIQKSAFGAIAGIEPYQDKDGKWKVRYNPKSGAVGVGLMAAGQTEGGRALASKIEEFLANKTLSSSEADVIKVLNGLEGEPMDYKVASKELGLTQAKVKAAEKTALEKLGMTAEELKNSLKEKTDLSSAGKKTVEAINQSTGQIKIGELNGRTFELGSYGKTHFSNKMQEGKLDRFPESELTETIKNIQESTRASDVPGNYRYDNVAWISKMPDGETRVIYTRENKNGAEELLSWHKVSEEKSAKYIEGLRKFGTPDRNRTGITALEPRQSDPLTYGSKDSVTQKGENVKSLEPFKNFPDLSTKVLGKLEGRTSVSKQFISDLTNSGDLKQTERDIIREALATEGDTVNVKQFADKVKAELLPLERKTGGYIQEMQHPRGSIGTVRYERISLPSEIRGPVQNYKENVYKSPIKTSAGDTHFPKAPGSENYFGHTRVEDMADNSTRRIIEVQSDLYQKGNLDTQIKNRLNAEGQIDPRGYIKMMKENGYDQKQITDWEKKIPEYDKAVEKAKAEISKLQQYNDPTAHFRMIREEVKKAAEDGKSILQFPTGETAMKIEGLGDNTTWASKPSGGAYKIDAEWIKENGAGSTVYQDGEPWVITHVLGEGKFKAVSENVYNDAVDRGYMQGEAKQATLDRLSLRYGESFDISGKVDTNNPIYKFYEKDVGKYLKNKYNAQLVTDEQGVKWWEVPVKKEHASMPVEAFGVIPVVGAGAAASKKQDKIQKAQFSYDNNGKKMKTPEVLDGGQIKTANTIKQIAKDAGHPEWADYLVSVAFYESRLGWSMTNHNKNGTTDNGYFMANEKAHPEISKADANDLKKSTLWAIKLIEKGRQKDWATNTIAKKHKIEIMK